MNKTTPIVRNHIRISRALFYEGMRATGNKKYLKSVKKVAVFVVLIFIAAAGWLLYTGGSLIFLLGEAVFLGALLFWLMFMLPGTKRSSKYKAMTKGSNSCPERIITFYQNYLSVTADDGKETVIQYNDIVSWQETKHLCLINCQNNLSVLLDKNGFDTGSFEATAKLLK